MAGVLEEGCAQSIIGATLKRLDSSGLVFAALERGSCAILLYVFTACFGAFSGGVSHIARVRTKRDGLQVYQES